MRKRISLTIFLCTVISISIYTIIAHAQNYIDLAPVIGRIVFSGPSTPEIRYSGSLNLVPLPSGSSLFTFSNTGNLTLIDGSVVAAAITAGSGKIRGLGMFKACSTGTFTLFSGGSYTAAFITATNLHPSNKVYVHGTVGGTYFFASSSTDRELIVYLYSASLAGNLDVRYYVSNDYRGINTPNGTMYDSSIMGHGTGFSSDTYIIGLHLAGSPYNGFNFVQGSATVCGNELT